MADIVCNYNKCRSLLNTKAWITSCSHAFCSNHAPSEINGTLKCPACETELSETFDVIKNNLNPPDAFKSIVLAGMKPDTIMEIAMRAMSFWTYQVEQENRYQEKLAKHHQEKANCAEQLCKLNTKKYETEILAYKRKMAVLQQESEDMKQRHERVQASLEDKNRKLQTLTLKLECNKRKNLNMENHARLPVNMDSNMNTTPKYPRLDSSCEKKPWLNFESSSRQSLFTPSPFKMPCRKKYKAFKLF